MRWTFTLHGSNIYLLFKGKGKITFLIFVNYNWKYNKTKYTSTCIWMNEFLTKKSKKGTPPTIIFPHCLALIVWDSEVIQWLQKQNKRTAGNSMITNQQRHGNIILSDASWLNRWNACLRGRLQSWLTSVIVVLKGRIPTPFSVQYQCTCTPSKDSHSLQYQYTQRKNTHSIQYQCNYRKDTHFILCPISVYS